MAAISAWVYWLFHDDTPASSPVVWGNAGQWVSGVITAGALAWAIVSSNRAYRQVHKSRVEDRSLERYAAIVRVVVRETQRRTVMDGEPAQEQREFPQSIIGPYSLTGAVEVHNYSDQPVFDVRVALQLGSQFLGASSRPLTLWPGDKRKMWYRLDSAVLSSFNGPEIQSLAPAIILRDAWENRWVGNALGLIRSITDDAPGPDRGLKVLWTEPGSAERLDLCQVLLYEVACRKADDGVSGAHLRWALPLWSSHDIAAAADGLVTDGVLRSENPYLRLAHVNDFEVPAEPYMLILAEAFFRNGLPIERFRVQAQM